MIKKYITKQSSIKGAGKGLFTNASFKKGELIGLAHVDDQPASEIGRNHNHNEKNPTANNIKNGNKRYLIASRNLKPGEEITTNYRLQPELEQPEDFMRKGGSVLRLPNKKNSKGYSRSLSATNKLFTQNFLFEKLKSRKNKVFDPNSKYYAEGGSLLTKKVTCKSCGWKWDAEDGGKDITTCHKCGGQGLVHAQDGGPTSPEEWGQQIKDIERQIGNPSDWTLSDYNTLQNKLNEYKSWRENTPEGQAVIDSHNEEGEYDIPLPEHLQDYTNAMMKARLAYANEFGNPAAERMINLPDNPYQFDNGDTGSHYMASMDNYAVPQIQDENGVLQLGDYGPESNEAIRFDSDEDANYFAENYKDVSPGFINEKKEGGASGCPKGFYWNGKKCVKAVSKQPTYADSLFLYNNSLDLDKWMKQNKYNWVGLTKYDSNKWDKRNLYDYLKTIHEQDIKDGGRTGPLSKYVEKLGNFIGTSDWLGGGFDDYGLPFTWKHPNIKPQQEGDMLPIVSNRIDNRNKQPLSYSFRYDPVAIKPSKLLTDAEIVKRYKKYGKSGIEESRLKKLGLLKNNSTDLPTTKTVLPTTRTVYVDCPSGSVSNGQIKDVTTPDPESPGNYLRTITTGCELEKIENLPILKPGLIKQQNYDLQGADEYNEALEPSDEENEEEESAIEEYITGKIKSETDRRINWRGREIPYKLLGCKFRQPENWDKGLINTKLKGKKRYAHLPTIEKRKNTYILDSDGNKKYITINDYKQYGGISDDYIEVDLNKDEIEEYRKGGYIVEEIDNYQNGGTVYTVKGSKGNYKKVNGKWQVDWNKSGKYQPLSKGNVKARTAVLDKMAKPVDNGISKVSSNSSDNTRVNYQKPLVESFNRSNNLESFYKKEREKDLQKQKDATAYHDKTQKVKQNQSFGEFINQDVLGIPTLEEQTKQVTNDKKLLKKELKPYFETEKEIDQFISQQYSRPTASAENNWNDGPIQLVYPEKYGIGPGGGMIGNIKNLGINTFNLGKKVLSNPYVSGGLNAYFGYHGINEFSDPNSLTRKSMSRVYDDPTGSNIGDAAWDVSMNSLNFVGLPFGKFIKGSKNLINNTYKINPWAFKANPEAYYHRSPNLENIVNRETGTLQGFGNSKAGIEFSKDAGPGGTGNLAIRGDGSVSRINLKKPANSQLYFSKGVPLDGGRYNKVLNKKTGKLIDGQGYEGPYMVEVEGVPMGASTKGRAPGADVTNIGGYAVPRRPISLDEAKFYKEHWLQGYKEVPKQLPGSPNAFKSEINWNNWNKEIPNNPELMKEYNAIEQQTKANGTWMKNPDGSVFKGTPEQFIQENSKNFKKSNLSSSKTYRVNIRGNDNNPIIHKPNSNIAFTGDEKSVRSYIFSGNKNLPLLSATDSPSTLGLHELYATGNKRLTIDAKNASFDNVVYNGKNDKTYTIAKESFLNPEINNVNILNVKNDLEGPMSLFEKIIGRKYGNELINKQVSGNYLKSARGNNGMFDMTNPNIYKSVLPIGLGLGATQYKQGGTTNDYIELDLTPKEIKDLIAQGYVIEELN